MRPVSKFAELNGPSMVEFPAVTLDVHDPHRAVKVGKCTFFAFSPFLRRNGVEKFFFEPGPKNLLAFIFEYLSNAVSRVPIRCRYEYGVPQFCRFSPWVSFHPSFCSDGSGAIHVFIGGRSCRPPAAGVGRGRLPSRSSSHALLFFFFFFFFIFYLASFFFLFSPSYFFSFDIFFF